MDLTLRPGLPADAAFVADVATAMTPDEPTDPAVEKYRWAASASDQVIDRRIVELGRQPVGFLVVSHLLWPPDDEVRSGYLIPGLLPELQTPERLRFLINHGLDSLRAHGARLARGEVWVHEAAVATAYRDLGFEEDAPERIWELDLVANRERLLEIASSSRAHLERQGVTLHTVADAPWPDVLDRLFDLTRRAGQDTPRTFPVPLLPRGLFDHWHGAPDVHWDRYWLARLEDRLVGLSFLSYPPERGNVWTGFTATDRTVRGRGIALGVKMPTLAQAIELGVARVRTGNDSRNAPILAINEKLGYRALPAALPFMKHLDDRPFPPRRDAAVTPA